MPVVVVSYTTGQYLDIALTTVHMEYIALAVALVYVMGRIQKTRIYPWSHPGWLTLEFVVPQSRLKRRVKPSQRSEDPRLNVYRNW